MLIENPAPFVKAFDVIVAKAKDRFSDLFQRFFLR
jgi:hypothetical protein